MSFNNLEWYGWICFTMALATVLHACICTIQVFKGKRIGVDFLPMAIWVSLAIYFLGNK